MIPQRVVLVTNIPNPYRIPLFNVLARKMSEKGMGLEVVFAARGYARRKWTVAWDEIRFNYQVLEDEFGISEKERKSGRFRYRGLLRLLRQARPQFIICGGFHRGTWQAAWHRLRTGCRLVIWSGSVPTLQREYSLAQRWHRRLLIRLAHAFAAYGTRAREYLVALGAKESKVHIAINTTDIEYYRNETERLRKGRSRLPGGPFHLLYMGNLDRRKRVDNLLHLMKELQEREVKAKLTCVGSGSQATKLQALALKLGVQERVSWEGFQPRQRIPHYLAAADCFVFPSEYDVWGMVLVEAMAAGLPCLASAYAGATADLILDGKTGYAVDFNQVERVATLIQGLIDHPGEIETLGKAALHFIAENGNLETAAGGFLAALCSARPRAEKVGS